MPRKLAAAERDRLLKTLEARFEKHMNRHPGLTWDQVRSRLEAHPDQLWSLHEMERTEGEPDVVGSEKNGALVFVDCSPQTPNRRSLCYDRAALDARKEHKPKDSAMDVARAMGIELLDEEQYRNLQRLEPFDTKTSSWILTPPAIRKLGGALFCDRRYDHVFTYHNGADAYYAGRGFRGILRV